MFGVDGSNVVCIVSGHVSESGEGLGWVGLGMFVWGVLWAGMHSSGVIVVMVVWCGVLVRLESRVTLWFASRCCVS